MTPRRSLVHEQVLGARPTGAVALEAADHHLNDQSRLPFGPLPKLWVERRLGIRRCRF
jgi:hypothetical protein